MFFFSSPLCSSQARGFVNYYGPQRFGSGQSVQSDRVGLALLKEDLVSAADDYWQHEPGAPPPPPLRSWGAAALRGRATLESLIRVCVCVRACQVAAVRLFFTPEEDDDAQNRAKRHFLQTGESGNAKKKKKKNSTHSIPIFPTFPSLLPRLRKRQGVAGAHAAVQAPGAADAARPESVRHRSRRLRAGLAQPPAQHEGLLPARLLQQVSCEELHAHTNTTFSPFSWQFKRAKTVLLAACWPQTEDRIVIV